MADIPWTADQLTDGIASAIKAHNFEAVEHMLRLLAVVDPRRAEDVWNTLQLAVMLGQPVPRPPWEPENGSEEEWDG